MDETSNVLQDTVDIGRENERIAAEAYENMQLHRETLEGADRDVIQYSLDLY